MVLGISTTGFSQIRDTLIWFKTEVGKASAFSPSFKTLAAQAMNSDDCTPPKGCDIVDPGLVSVRGEPRIPGAAEPKLIRAGYPLFRHLKKPSPTEQGKTYFPKVW